VAAFQISVAEGLASAVQEIKACSAAVEMEYAVLVTKDLLFAQLEA
jgi:hypothetical protein